MSSNATSLTQAELSALLSAPGLQANLSMLGLSGNAPTTTAIPPSAGTFEGSEAASFAIAPAAAAAAAAHNSNLLVLLQRQAEEQQKLAQLAALTGSLAGNPSDNLALLLHQHHQQQLLLQLQAINNYPAASTAVGNRLLGLGGVGLGIGGFGGLGEQSGLLGLPSVNHDLLAMSKLLPSVGNPIMVPSPAPTFQDMASLPNILQDRKRKGRTGTFPQKLHTMLSDLEHQEGGSLIASFLPHGRAFAIHKPRDFQKHVMPKYFRMGKFSSFQRQLNLYDFQRITDGADKGAYYHELFVQSRPILSTMMKRNKIKGKGTKNQQQQPHNFQQQRTQVEQPAGSKKDEDYEEEDQSSSDESDDGEDKEDE
jgi:hypothetical protein